MRLSLADVKKRVARRKGELYLIPTLLRRDELLPEIGALIALYEAQVGRASLGFPTDQPAELIGDYRLARALEIVLGEYYTWTSEAWPGPASTPEAAALAGHGIGTSGQLRLALYDEVNAAHGGYLAAAAREAALDAFAARLGIGRATLEALLVLDHDEHARLERAVPTPPTPIEVLVCYNQRAVEALLANSSSVEWLLPPEFAASQGTSLGTVLKRLCFLARQLGVLYDVEFAMPEHAADGPARHQSPADIPAASEHPGLARVAEVSAAYAMDATEHTVPAELDADVALQALHVTLYGPREVFGAPNQYGDRLARVCRAWLGYHRHARDAAPAVRARRQAAVASSGLRGTALVELRGTRMRFTLDEALLAVLEDPSATDTARDNSPPGDPSFDSALESRLYGEFSALARASETFGWNIEREPEPVLAAGTILIPDFALTRGAQRVYLEVAGFWTPEYRERKRRKLSALAGHAALIVAAPEDARAELSALDALLPVLWFKGRVGAQALLTLLRARFEDLALRRAAVPLAAIFATVERRGVVPWEACGRLLGAYGRSETALLAGDVVVAAQARGRTPLVFVEGVGLLTVRWLERVGAALGAWLRAAEQDAAAGHLALGEVGRRMRSLLREEEQPGAGNGPPDGDLTDSWVEALVWATGFAVERASLFEPYVVARPGTGATAATDPPAALPPAARAQPRQPSRRRVHVTAQTAAEELPIPWEAPETAHETPRRGVREDRS